MLAHNAWFDVRVLPGPSSILVLTEISRFSASSPNWRAGLARFCLCNSVLEPSRPFRALCLCPENSVSRQQRLWFEETRFDCVIIELPGPYYEVHKRSGFMLQVEDKPGGRARKRIRLAGARLAFHFSASTWVSQSNKVLAVPPTFAAEDLPAISFSGCINSLSKTSRSILGALR